MRSIPTLLLYSRVLLFLFSIILITTSANAQQIIRGKITDNAGSILSGATISVKGTKNITTSDSAGRFALAANPGATLEISYIGYSNYQYVLGNETELNLSLTRSTENLDSVVVIGYGTIKKKDLTGAVSSVSEKDFNIGIFASPDQLIQGKVSGLQITDDNGQPGGAATIKIRGNAALSGTGQPLFVIDGVPLDGRTLQAGVNPIDGSLVQNGVNPLNFINPDDIASIDILKDASASAIYGSRAAYGVIIINTKKAIAGTPKLNVSINTGISSILKKIEVLDAAQYREAIKFYNVDPSLDKGGTADGLDAILQNALQQNYTIGVTGGNESGKYRLSANLLNQDGIIINTGLKKYGVSIGTNFKFLDSKKLGLDINVNSNQYIQDVPQPEYSAAALVVAALKWNPTNSLRNTDGSINMGTADNPNPIAVADYLKNSFKVTTILASIAPYYKFNNWLEYKLLASINYSTGITRSSTNQDFPNSQGGSASISNSELITQQFTQTLNFNRKISNNLHLDAVLGYEYMQFTMKGSSLKGTGAQGTGFGNFGLDYTNYVQYSGTGNRSISSYIDPVTKLQSFFSRAIFNVKDKYLLTATIRADGSTKFGDNNQFGYFPSFAAAWVISEEDFFNIKFFNSLKIRAGWGKTGNQEFTSGASQAKYSFRDNGTLIQVNSPNPNLKWQADKQFNIGVDFSMLNNRISATLDYFNKNTTDLLFPSPPIQPSPPSSVVRWINLDGEIINKGFEILVNGLIVEKKDFNWNLSVNATFLQNTVRGLPSTVYTGFISGPVQVIQNGLPMQTFYTRKFLGLDKANGLSVYEDDGASFYPVGNPNPSMLLGLSSTFNYQKLSLTANMYGAFGQDIYNVTLMSFLNVSNIQRGNNIALSVFNEPVKESLANPVTPSSRFIMSGSYFKMANLTLAYAFGNVGKTFKGMNVYITAQNLFVITKYPGFDPELNTNASINNIPSLGIDYPHYPTARTFLFGLNFSL
jgi:iron complex outermembrane receptor protein